MVFRKTFHLGMKLIQTELDWQTISTGSETIFINTGSHYFHRVVLKTRLYVEIKCTLQIELWLHCTHICKEHCRS